MRALLANVALSVLSLALALGLGELVVRVALPQQLILIRPDLWQPVDTLGWAHRPDVRTTVNTGERTVPVFTDRDGYRVGPGGRSEAATRILVLGDSYVEALQVPYEQSLSGLLETRLPQLLGRPVAVRDAAVGGWEPSQYLLETRRHLRREPCWLVVVAIYVGNDVVTERTDAYRPRAPVGRAHFRLPRQASWPEIVRALLAPLNDLLEVRSQLYILVRSRLEVARMRAGLASSAFPKEFLRREASSPAWGVTAGICRALADEAEARGARTLFVLVPTAYQVDSTWFAQQVRGYRLDPAAVDLEQPTRLLAREMDSRGLDVFDALPVFRQAQARGGPPLHGRVDHHFSPAGHRVLAEALLPRIVALLRAPPPRAPDGAGGASR